jgi:hypothetical protein
VCKHTVVVNNTTNKFSHPTLDHNRAWCNNMLSVLDVTSPCTKTTTGCARDSITNISKEEMPNMFDYEVCTALYLCMTQGMYAKHVCAIVCALHHIHSQHVYCQTSKERGILSQLNNKTSKSNEHAQHMAMALPNLLTDLNRSTRGRHRSEKGGTLQTVLPGLPQEKGGK